MKLFPSLLSANYLGSMGRQKFCLHFVEESLSFLKTTVRLYQTFSRSSVSVLSSADTIKMTITVHALINKQIVVRLMEMRKSCCWSKVSNFALLKTYLSCQHTTTTHRQATVSFSVERSFFCSRLAKCHQDVYSHDGLHWPMKEPQYREFSKTQFSFKTTGPKLLETTMIMPPTCLWLLLLSAVRTQKALELLVLAFKKLTRGRLRNSTFPWFQIPKWL